MEFEYKLKQKIKQEILKDAENKSKLNLKSTTERFLLNEEALEKEVEILFDQRINCGGYALELDTCIFNYSRNFEKAVSELLKKIPFIRLLGDKKLEDNEYIVVWKVREGGGHHFIKILEDGTIVEKDGAGPVKKFSSWIESLKGCPEAVFAVKKDHDMNLQKEKDYSIGIGGNEGLNFEETAQEAVKKKSNEFEYHNHLYYFKTDDVGKKYICSNNRIIANIFLENNQCLVDVLKNEQKYVSNTQPTVSYNNEYEKLQNSKIER